MLRVVEDHLSSTQVSRVIYGSIIGLALVVALEHDPPRPAVLVGTLAGTALAVGLAELYSEIIGTEVRTRRPIARSHVGEIAADVGAVAFGIAFPAVFFLLSVAGAMKIDTAFTLAKWSGLALIGVYGFFAARLAGERLPAALAQAVAVALIGGFLIGLKALVH
jgi:VIT1/CCC1 family predicted Fe2+/Mn2+ transporter